MFALLALTLLAAPVFSSQVASRLSSFTGEYGIGSGVAFSTSGEHQYGLITGLRIWESTSYITGIQIRFGSRWSSNYGSYSGVFQELILYNGEHIRQVSGKLGSYINELIFLTSLGRMLRVGQPSGTSFNSFPLHNNTILRYVSGRYSGSLITSIGFHWDQARSQSSAVAAEELAH